MTILSAQDLTYGYFESAPLLRSLNLNLQKHELLLIGGPNGVGKSTFLQIALGFPPSKVFAGKIQLNVSSREVAWIPQLENPEFHLPLTLRDVLQISLPGPWSDGAALGVGLLKLPQLDFSWNQASGGERKRTLLTRALLHRPKLLLLDEPMNHLDTESRQLIVTVLGKYLKGNEAAAVIISHDALSGNELSLFRRQTLQIETDHFTLERSS